MKNTEQLSNAQLPTYEEGKQWYAENFDCSETFSQLIPDLEETEPEVSSLSREMSVRDRKSVV